MSYFSLPGFSNSYPVYKPLNQGFQTCMDCYTCKLKVEGKGSIKVQPDTAVVNLGVVTEDKQLEYAQEENTKKVTEVLNTLRRMGVSQKDIETQSYIIDPQYDYVDGKQVFRGYKVLHSLQVTVRDVDKIGEIIDKAVESGANIVNRINFTVSEPSKLYQQALKAAIDDALVKAITIGKKLKICVSQVPVNIVEKGYKTGVPFETTFSKAPEIVTPIQPGQIDITAWIEAVFAYVTF